MVKAIPERWTEYGPIGRQIEGTRFIAFKVPLKENISNRVEVPHRLDDQILLEKIPNLGLIIDLTNTKRYYKPEIFTDKGVAHIKINVPGKKIPRSNITSNFIRTAKEFIKENIDNDKLIGIHCTHGVNRTGYMICKYMISVMGIEPKEAIEKFANARGHRIERDNYILDLETLPKARQENWRQRKQDDEQSPNHKRIKREDNINNSYKNPRRHYNSNRNTRSYPTSSNYRERNPNTTSSNYRERNPNYYYQDNAMNNTYSNRRSHENRDVRYHDYNPHLSEHYSEQYRDIYCTMLNNPPSLTLDYYNTRPEFNRNRYN